MTNDPQWRARLRKRSPEKVRELNRRYGQSAKGKAAIQRKLQRKRDVIAGERECRGGRCQDCWGAEELVWHHRDPDEKKFSVSEGIIRSYKNLYAELFKCDLLCQNCHAKRHNYILRGAV